MAEELHFGRAAERLGIAQPPLSRAILQLERQLGVTLLNRTSRSVTLTEAGAVLLSEGRVILGAMTAAERRTQRAAADHPSLVIVTKAGTSEELLAKLLDAYAREPGAVPVELQLCDAQQQKQLLREGRADVSLIHLPFDSTAGLDTEVIGTEGQVAVLPATHLLAGRASVHLSDLAALSELPPAHWPDADGAVPEGPGVRITSLTQLFQLIALGRTTVVVPESVCVNLRRDLVAIPVLDAPVVSTLIAWPALSRSRTVADLVRVATQL